MEFTSRITTENDITNIVRDLTIDENQEFDLAFLFVSLHSKDQTKDIIAQVNQKLNVRTFMGCSCNGTIGINNEIEKKPACSLILAKFSEVRIIPFFIDQKQLELLSKPESWHEFLEIYPNEEPKFLILPDPFLLDMNRCIIQMNKAYPNCPVIGGLASGAMESHGNVLFLNNEFYDEGLIGVALTGNVRIESIVSQGCRPIGKPYIITKAQDNIILELAGQPFWNVLENELRSAPPEDRMLAQEAIFLGLAMDEYKHKMSRGDFLIRMVIGIDEQSGAGAVADIVKPGQTVQFHVRDALSSTEDLNALLRSQQELKPSTNLQGALVFSCNGRGEGLFREKNHDIGIIQQHIGKVPTAGFFCAGEIGPVGGKNFLHGFTSSIALFYPEHE